MQITVVTSGLLKRHLPEGAKGGRAEITLADGATPIDAMSALGLPLDEAYLTVLNGDLLPSAEREAKTLSADDELGIFPPLKGG